MPTDQQHPLRILILCTGNSARSQIAEALLQKRGGGRFHVESAGSHPAGRVNPLAIEALRDAGIEWQGRTPRGLESVEARPWDFVVTVCDRAREACPLFPGTTVRAHWGMPDPAEVEGPDEEKRRAFQQTLLVLSRRIDRFLAIPFEKIEREALVRRVREIGNA
jgi:arsenate reductase